MENITDMIVDGLKYPFNDVNKYFGFGIVQVIMSAFFIGGFASLGSYFYQAYSTSVSMGLESVDLAVVSPAMMVAAIILFLLGLLAFVFISGYEFNVLKFSISKSSELPSFNDYLGILKDGLRLVAVQIAYAVPPLILILIGLMLSVNAHVGAAVNVIGSFILAIAIIFAIVVGFVQVMAYARMADKGNLRSAFDFREIIGMISKMGIVEYVGILIFLAIAIAIITVAASAILEFIGFAVALIVPAALASIFLVIILRGLLLNSFTGIATYRVFGSLYNVAAGNDFKDKTESELIEDSNEEAAVLDSKLEDSEIVDSEIEDSKIEDSEIVDSKIEDSELLDSEVDSQLDENSF